MAVSFNRIAYAALDACNAVSLDAVVGMAARAAPPPGARALDIGCGNAAVAIALARAGMAVTAVEADPAMAALARARIARSGAPVQLIEGRADAVLADAGPFDLIVSLGAIEPAGGGLRRPAEIFAALFRHVAPGGALLWGDVVWKQEPPAPLVQMTAVTNLYADDAGWRAAASDAGLAVAAARMSTEAEWNAYLTGMDTAVADWLADHPDAAEARSVRAAAHRVKLLFDFGRPFMDFGLYLLRRPSDDSTP